MSAAAITGPAATKNWDNLLRRYATQATIALSLVAGISGVMLFFHLGEGFVKELHEWLGMGFAIVAVLHGLRHRHAVAAMLKQPRMQVLFTAAALATAAFVIAAPAKGPNPFRQASQVVMQAPLKDLAPLVGTTPEVLTERLRTAGVAAADTTLSIEAIARAQGANPVELMAAALRK